MLKIPTLIDFCLGIQTIRKRAEGWMMLLQENSCRGILYRFDMENCDAIADPMEAGYTLSRPNPCQQDGIHQIFNIVSYPHIVGCLMHAIIQTRPFEWGFKY